MLPADIAQLVDDRPDDGIFRVSRKVFTDPDIFDLERKFIFEKTWNFLSIESEVARPGDFITTSIANTPLIVSRDAAGQLRAFSNVCRHKGAVVARTERGNAKFHMCRYHGWTYDSAGKNVDVKLHASGHYSPAFDRENHDLQPIARLETYKGLVFGSLSPHVPPLDDYLGELKFFLDLVMDQGPHGMEFIPGRAIYTFRANWKMQMDNGLDSYHLDSTHASFANLLGRRRKGEGNQDARSFDWAKRTKANGGSFTFKNGHSAVWSHQTEPEKRPIYPSIDEVRDRIGNDRADWMLRLRNTIIFPNFQTADSTSLLLRTFKPIAVDKTEMHVHCLAPIGEAREVRSWRIRQFEDFFNPSGFATPDDSMVYEDCQTGAAGSGFEYLDGYGRGFGLLERGANATAVAAGFSPESSLEGPFDVSTETWHHAPHREWKRMMDAGIAGREPYL